MPAMNIPLRENLTRLLEDYQEVINGVKGVVQIAHKFGQLDVSLVWRDPYTHALHHTTYLHSINLSEEEEAHLARRQRIVLVYVCGKTLSYELPV